MIGHRTPSLTRPGHVGPVARALGFAGLLPQVAVLMLIARNRGGTREALFPLPGIADLYAAIILSFLGGMWWGFAMRRERGQGALAALAVMPSLLAAALLGWSGLADTGWSSVGLGIAILLTLFVDRHLAATGEAPAGWMALRIPLSVGLGTLTIAAGALSY